MNKEAQFAIANRVDWCINKHISFNIYLTNYCNLRCKYCCRYCNITKHPQNYKTEDVISDMLHIANKIKLFLIRYNGGEPLLHPDIVELCKFLGKYKQKFDIPHTSIYTNGKKILSMPDEFFKILRQYQIGIDYTKYPKSSGIDYNEIIKRLDDENISHCNFIGDTRGLPDEGVVKSFGALRFYPNSTNQLSKLAYSTCTNVGPSLWLGKIYKCCNTPFIDTFNDVCNTDLKLTQIDDYTSSTCTDCISVADVNTENLIEWVKHPSYFCSKICPKFKGKSISWQIGTNTKEELCAK